MMTDFCDTGCEGLFAALLLALTLGLLVWLSWVVALAWWLQLRGRRTIEAWPTALVVVAAITWLMSRLMHVDALSPFTPLLSLFAVGPVVAVVVGRSRRRRSVHSSDR